MRGSGRRLGDGVVRGFVVPVIVLAAGADGFLAYTHAVRLGLLSDLANGDRSGHGAYLANSSLVRLSFLVVIAATIGIGVLVRRWLSLCDAGAMTRPAALGASWRRSSPGFAVRSGFQWALLGLWAAMAIGSLASRSTADVGVLRAEAGAQVVLAVLHLAAVVGFAITVRLLIVRLGRRLDELDARDAAAVAKAGTG